MMTHTVTHPLHPPAVASQPLVPVAFESVLLFASGLSTGTLATIAVTAAWRRGGSPSSGFLGSLIEVIQWGGFDTAFLSLCVGFCAMVWRLATASRG